LAHWLRDLTDESDLIIARLQSILADTRETIRVLTEDRIGGLESCLSDFSNDGQSLFNMIETANGLMVRTSSGFDAAASSLPIQIASATGELERFSERLDRLGSHLMGLQLFKDTVSDQGASDPDRMSDILSSLRSKYTMEGERIIHDELFGGDFVSLEAVADTAPDAGSDDLDDILF
jgi:methyl-accepting chemotaxis protein